MTARAQLVAFFAGVVFAVGLGIAGMTDPGKVLGFLDVFGQWDASLALVMAGAIAVHLPLLRFTRHRSIPSGEDACAATDGAVADRTLLGGSALFGVGWGLAGYCPGPALVSLATGGVNVIVFVLAMLLGSWGFASLTVARPLRISRAQ
jgi:uncharacterized protein